MILDRAAHNGISFIPQCSSVSFLPLFCGMFPSFVLSSSYFELNIKFRVHIIDMHIKEGIIILISKVNNIIMDRNFQKGHLYISHSWEYSQKRTITPPLSVLITKHCILFSTNKNYNQDIIVEHCQQMSWLHQCTSEQCTGLNFQPLCFIQDYIFLTLRIECYFLT